MIQDKVLIVENREQWRNWLMENYQNEKEVILVVANKNDDSCLSYNDAVEEALCFGWIDGVAGKIDDKQTRRFTPRKNNNYSRMNVERLLWLDQKGLIMPEVRESVKEILGEDYQYPNDIIEQLKSDEIVWDNFNKFSKPYQRIRIAQIELYRDEPEQFRKRLDSFLKKTRENKLILGFGWDDKYLK